MKKILKIVGIIAAILVLILLTGFLFVTIRGIPTYEVEKIDYNVSITSESIEQGKKLTLMLCANCHMNPETGKLTGTRMADVPSEFGEIFSQNITQDKEFGIGNWTDGELVYLLRTGINKDGRYTPPYMAKLPHMSDEDINAIISFLRSKDELVEAAPVPDTPCKPSFLTKFLSHVAFKPLPMPKHKIYLPDTADKVELGRYLAHNLDCYACHSADFKKMNIMNPELSDGYFGGGNKPLNREGKIMVTPNLTPDNETGIGTWSEEKFIKSVKYGFKEGENALRYPMMPYPYLTDAEASAIYQYLKTIPPIKNKIERSSFSEESSQNKTK